MADKKKNEKPEVKTPETPEEKEKKPKKEKEEMVEIQLFYDGRRYKDDVDVCINGRHWLIQRGKKVKVPKSVAEVIDNADKQKGFANDVAQNLADDYRDRVEKNFQG